METIMLSSKNARRLLLGIMVIAGAAGGFGATRLAQSTGANVCFATIDECGGDPACEKPVRFLIVACDDSRCSTGPCIAPETDAEAPSAIDPAVYRRMEDRFIDAQRIGETRNILLASAKTAILRLAHAGEHPGFSAEMKARVTEALAQVANILEENDEEERSYAELVEAGQTLRERLMAMETALPAYVPPAPAAPDGTWRSPQMQQIVEKLSMLLDAVPETEETLGAYAEAASVLRQLPTACAQSMEECTANTYAILGHLETIRKLLGSLH